MTMAMSPWYEANVIEPQWQERWERAKLFRAGQRPHAPEKYILEMLPYPSGAMHMGHVRNYLIGDVYARYYRMRGFDVLHPMGWDSFGLPAENAAIKEGVHPRVRTLENIVSFKAVFLSLGAAYDWSREISTCEPEYYRWNQWFFLRFLEKGLVYRRLGKVNWCPNCLTPIANEQVKDGRCERCDSVVIEKEMPEWAFRITRYADSLLEGLDTLTRWPERITSMQRNWIGRSEGVEADFLIPDTPHRIRIFTTRIDTVFGCTYLVLAPDHKLVPAITTSGQKHAVQEFADRMASIDRIERTAEHTEKEGVFTGAYALNPFTRERLPVWVANFVVADYGTGAVMSVPAHDQRDFEFAKKYGLPLRVVVQPTDGPRLTADTMERAFTEDGVLVDSGPFTNLSSAEARRQMAKTLRDMDLGKPAVIYRQKDWGFSRQRYWGTPIPIIYCDRCDPEHKGIPVPDDQLPVRLPEIDTASVLTGRGAAPLAKVPSFVNTVCPRCGGPAQREVETMDTFVDSSWYYARYLSPHYELAPFEQQAARRWLPVDLYVGGPEHAVMHLLYFRFWARVMKELGLTPNDEPVTRLVTQGIVNGPDGRKMSKRWGNVVQPKALVEKYGADTARVYVLFAGPPERDIDWSDDQVEGANRFLKRVWALAEQNVAASSVAYGGAYEGKALEIRRATHKSIKRITDSIERLSFNTAIAGLMEFLNALQAAEPVTSPAEKSAMAEAIRSLALLITPFAPHIADEIAQAYGADRSTVTQAWPAFDPALVIDDVLTYAVQINGKLRSEVQVPTAAGEAEVRSAAEANEKVRGALRGKEIRRVVFVPRRLINFVVAG